ncbi:microfibril-associated glycoprotein 4-like [Diadema setosum]|uniref:microfibril-associated glycoprotein 4-like n=1 Tax=Diadema setosum TaxID=31175 RepID=UPI003B3BDF6F
MTAASIRDHLAVIAPVFVVVFVVTGVTAQIDEDPTTAPTTISVVPSDRQCDCQEGVVVFRPHIQIRARSPERSSLLSQVPVAVNACRASLLTSEAQLRFSQSVLDDVSDFNQQRSVRTVPVDACPRRPEVMTHELRPIDCADALSKGMSESGSYVVYPNDGRDPIIVFCDMETDDGGWTVIQRRKDSDVDFNRQWLEYKNGFGSVRESHWLGLENVRRFVSARPSILRVDLRDFEGETAYATYYSFYIGPESDKYQLFVSRYDGDAGDSLSYHNRMYFSTVDSDNDPVANRSCALRYESGWWFHSCFASNLNGQYLESPNNIDPMGICWTKWKLNFYSMNKVEMKIRPLY